MHHALCHGSWQSSQTRARRPAVPGGAPARGKNSEEVAAVILFLLSDSAGYVLGAELRVTGGR
jgi:NAD(P)-dependent dehydrogenase (short-subunit alcohol dehydrogenase family)